MRRAPRSAGSRRSSSRGRHSPRLPATLGEASVVDEGGGVWGPFCRALALQGLGHPVRARTEITAALELAPDLLEDPASLLVDILLAEDQRETVLSLLRPMQEHAGPTAAP